MASIILSAAGAAVGSAIPVVGPLIGSAVGRAIGASAGGVVDNAVFGSQTRNVEGARLGDLSVQVSTYGKTIPLIYGTARMAGNVIWATKIKETSTTTTTRSGGGKGGGGGGTKTTSTNYSYSVSLAIAICAGEINELTRIWADAKLLDFSYGTPRLYKGGESQLPDPLIEAIEGVGNCPAYRGLAYVVLEDFPLGDFGNRIPNFTFEVRREVKYPDYQGQTTEEMVRSMTIIPGAGEFVYDTIKQSKLQGEYAGAKFGQTALSEPINYHTGEDTSNAIVAVDKLLLTCPNLEWVSVVVTWFGDNLDAGTCTILPAVEYQNGITSPSTWSVAGYNRTTARQMTLVNDSPRYGGTPDDASVVRFVAALKARGLKVMLYPMFFMDTPDKPWRGRVSGTAANVASFFTKANGYNAFINHYANLMQNKVDAFVIGSELIGLTKVTSSAGVYPAVNALVALAASVKTTMGAATKITYAADWSEYHHTDGGWYNLDPLWASPNIDMIGIDAYFPLTNAPQSQLGYNLQNVINGWDSGEGYDFYFTDGSRTTTASLGAAYAWKNINWFWSNDHYNPNGVKTAWVPGSKKIWFTEYGFPSVDGASNQPNVFYDPTSSESYFPRFSSGLVDFRAQRTAITATEARFKNSTMIERMFLWTWDARPFPYFPDLRNVWADGGVWVTGHWVSGKFGISGLAGIVYDICKKAGLSDAQIDVSRLNEAVEGYIITGRTSARSAIEELMSAYFFDCVESEQALRFVPRGGASVANIDYDELLFDGKNEAIRTTVRSENELPSQTEVLFLDRTKQYQIGTARAFKQISDSRVKMAGNFPLVLSVSAATAIAEKTLYLAWLGRTSYRLSLDLQYAALQPSDVITINQNGSNSTMRIVKTVHDAGRIIIDAVSENVGLYEPSRLNEELTNNNAVAVVNISPTEYEFLDIPALPNDNPNDAMLRVAANGVAGGWSGAAIYSAIGGDYSRIGDVNNAAIMGIVQAIPLGFSGGNVIDEVNFIDVLLSSGAELQSISEQSLLSGANAAVVGGEIIQFMEAQMLARGKYRLRRLLRGRLGTEDMIISHIIGERFILLDYAVAAINFAVGNIGLARDYKAVTYGATLGEVQPQSFTHTGLALKPYSPVHLQMSGAFGNDINFSWVRRDRLYGAWRDGGDIGMSESQELYDFEIWASGNLKRTAKLTSPSFNYTQSMQNVDGIVSGTNIICKLWQISNTIGRGKPAEISFIA
jgi:GTA TIM-barrel-like domain/Putative phage tail protein